MTTKSKGIADGIINFSVLCFVECQVQILINMPDQEP